MRRRRTSLLSLPILILTLFASACTQQPVSSGVPTAALIATSTAAPASNRVTATFVPTGTPKPPAGTPTPTITPPGTAVAQTAAANVTPTSEQAAAAAATGTAIATVSAGQTASAPTPTSGNSSVPVTSGSLQNGGDSPTLESLPPTSATLKQANACNLINSSDLAHLFPPHNEITRQAPQTSPVSHPPFSDTAAKGTETRCLFFDFHQPGSAAGWMLQVTYLVDAPDPAAGTAWSQAWSEAKSKAGQPISGLGDDAFTSGANLYIKKGDFYLTFEAVDTHIDAKTPGGAQQLLVYEQQLAQAAMERLK